MSRARTDEGLVAGRLDRARSWVAGAGRRRRSVGLVLAVLRRDLEIGGTLLAGALAFRLFVWLLPCCLLLAAVLGFTASDDKVDVFAQNAGFGSVTTNVLDQVAGQAEGGRYVTGALGLVLLLVTGVSLGRALDRVHGRIWQDDLDPRVKPTVARVFRYTAVLLLVVLGNITGPLVASAAGAPLVLIALPLLAVHVVLAVVLFGGDWPPRWRRDLPGAALVALGIAGLHLASVLYLPHKLARASQLYGTLGMAATMLVWLALIARLLVLGQVLNFAWRESERNAGC